MTKKSKTIIVSIAVILGLLFGITTGCTHSVWRDTIKTKRSSDVIKSFIINEKELMLITSNNFYSFDKYDDQFISLLKNYNKNNIILNPSTIKARININQFDIVNMSIQVDIANQLLTKNSNDYLISNGFHKNKNNTFKRFFFTGQQTNKINKTDKIKIDLNNPVNIMISKAYIDNDYMDKIINTPLMLLLDIVFIIIVLIVLSIPFLIIHAIVSSFSK